MNGFGAKPIGSLRNIGPRSAHWLVETGVATDEDLRRIGPVAAYARVKAAQPKTVSLNLLWSLQAALLDIRSTDLPDEMKAALKRELAA